MTAARTNAAASSAADQTTQFGHEQPTMFQAGDAATRIPGFETLVGDAPTSGFEPCDPSDHGPLNVGQVFGTRYHIIRLLGVGGMGAVYHAWDEVLQVAVAIKVIRPEVMADPVAAADIERRFKRELLLARKVTHRNVVRIHDIGEIDRIKYITMEYVNGADLATLIRQEGGLTVARTLHIARSVVTGLVAAHTAGVVHRDLKPANIMIDVNDEALIMDFGIARSTAEPAPRSPASDKRPAGSRRSLPKYTDATAVGSIVGTVEYMAPEQAQGLEVDQRADIYAFGLILYDMLAGRRRAQLAGSAFSELQARLDQPLPPVGSVVPDVPEALDRIISKCIEPDREKRFQSTAEVAAEFDRLDENGQPIPIAARVSKRMMAAAAALVILLLVGTFVLTRQAVQPPKEHEPVSVLIADFQNGTGDPTFDRTLEPMLKRALEDAGFISAYDHSGIRRVLGVRPPDRLDEAAAREIAVRQGLGVVLSGTIERQGTGFALSVRAAHAVTGNVIASAKGRAANKDQVLGAATRLVTAVRKALGDETSDSEQLFAMASVSATSLEVIRHYAAAREAASNNKLEEARRSYAKAVELDPKFGIGYQALASLSQNLGNLQDAERYIKEALRHLDGMTERERYTTRGSFDFLAGDYQQCVKEFGDLIARYPADVAAHNNLALCLTYLRKMPEALQEMRRVVELLPKQAFFRVNLALYASYASDFQNGEDEVRALQEPDARGVLALAFAQLGQGQVTQAIETYQRLGTIDALGASSAASGLADIAAFEGRFSDAVRILQEGTASDLNSRNSDRAAVKFTSLAYAHLSRGQAGPAVAAAEKALANSQAVGVRFLAARTFVEAGELARARPLIAGLAGELQAEPQAYARIVEGQIAFKNGDPRQTIKILTEANGLFDTWIGHFDLGRAYLAFGALPQADAEFDRCIKRRGEALSLFLDEEPTYAYFPTVFYYQGRVREELKTEGFKDRYREYLNIRGKSTEDPLLQEVRRRANS